MKKLILLISIICLSYVSFGQVFGNAISLDGVDDYGVVTSNSSLNPYHENWSMTCWIKAANKNQIAPIIMKRNPDAPWPQYSYGFGKDDPHEPQAGKKIRYNYIEAAGVTERSGHTTAEIIDGNWHHLAIIADKDENGIIIYVDGVTVDIVPMFYYGSWPNIYNGFDLYMAHRGSGDKLEGIIDELSLWHRALKQNEIQMFMDNPIPAAYYETADSGVVAYYKFEEFENLVVGASGDNDIRDMSSYDNHMDIKGLPSLVPSVYPESVQDQTKTSLYFGVFPNPCEEKICLRYSISDPSASLRTSNARLEATDISGRIVKSMELQGQEMQTIDFSDLPAGVYFLKLESEGAVGVQKIIKK